MTRVRQIAGPRWDEFPNATSSESWAGFLEGGDVLFLPQLRFEIGTHETSVFTPAILGSSKNASFDPGTGRLGGTTASGTEVETLRTLIARFSDAAATLTQAVLPEYRGQLMRRRASFRPAEIAGRASSWRKDDTRLHVDSFPATPSGGRRILRVFSNVNPDGRARSWRVGDDFAAVAQRFAPQLKLPLPGLGYLLALARITKSPRSAYDALMLQLHDCMKGDEDFQSASPQTAVEFPAGSTWLAFTDEVSHAAMAGQYQLEQTFLLPVAAMRSPDRSPLRILERLKDRRLA
jgi:hypothetical protein